MHLWDKLLPQAERTLNMLRPARVAPNISAYAYMHGQHDFNAHPLAPMGMETEIHLKPTARDTWEEHSASGWNLGTSMEHYRCYEVYVDKTLGIRVGIEGPRSWTMGRPHKGTIAHIFWNLG